MRTSGLLILATVVIGSVGCAAQNQNQTAEPSGTSDPQSGLDAATLAQKSPNRANVSVGGDIAKLCNLSAPKFAFDSEHVQATAQRELDAIASCFVSGPGKGKAMNLVGYADPRGETMYNFGLGQRRAASVASYLQKRGIEDERLRTSSRGELDAIGTDDASWAEDRRVELRLAD